MRQYRYESGQSEGASALLVELPATIIQPKHILLSNNSVTLVTLERFKYLINWHRHAFSAAQIYKPQGNPQNYWTKPSVFPSINFAARIS